MAVDKFVTLGPILILLVKGVLFVDGSIKLKANKYFKNLTM